MQSLPLNLHKFQFILFSLRQQELAISAFLSKIYFMHVMSAMAFLIFRLCLLSFLYFLLFDGLRTPLPFDKLHLTVGCPTQGLSITVMLFAKAKVSIFSINFTDTIPSPAVLFLGVSCLMLFSRSCCNVSFFFFFQMESHFSFQFNSDWLPFCKKVWSQVKCTLVFCARGSEFTVFLHCHVTGHEFVIIVYCDIFKSLFLIYENY